MTPLNIPLYLQDPDIGYCIPYALTGIAQYFGIRVSKSKMIKLCKATKSYGCYSPDQLQGVEKIGLKFERIKFKYQDIRKALTRGFPVVLSYMAGNDPHFSTIIFARKEERGVFYILNDTLYGRFEIPGELLEYLWKRDESWIRKVGPS